MANRIRQYDSLWRPSTSPVCHERAPAAPNDAPAGFVALPLEHLTSSERQAIAAQADLYRRAYELARRQADEKFIRDWTI